MTNNQQDIYNKHLYALRASHNQPFSPRKDFTKIEDEKELALYKLEQMFSSYPTIDINSFFIAPYKMSPETNHFDLSFYTTYKAKSYYTAYIKRKEVEDPDSDDIIMSCKEGFKNISYYCRDQHMTLTEYMTKWEGPIPLAVLHLKEHKINMYVLHALNLGGMIKMIDQEMLKFIIPSFHNMYRTSLNKYANSKKLKQFSKNSIQILSDNL